jgi:Flp pilus assembly protein TadD
VVHGINGDTARAAEAYRRLFEKSPDNLEWGMRLAGAQYSMGQEEEARRRWRG